MVMSSLENFYIHKKSLKNAIAYRMWVIGNCTLNDLWKLYSEDLFLQKTKMQKD